MRLFDDEGKQIKGGQKSRRLFKTSWLERREQNLLKNNK